jgi:hypothetical protein
MIYPPTVPNVDPECMRAQAIRDLLRIWKKYPFKNGSHPQLQVRLESLSHWQDRYDEKLLNEGAQALADEWECDEQLKAGNALADKLLELHTDSETAQLVLDWKKVTT